MLQTYKATLRGNHLEWSGDAPEYPEKEQPVKVYVTILLEAASSSSSMAQGKRMAAVLEKLVSINALSGISDPAEWQRDQRQDRALPDRDE